MRPNIFLGGLEPTAMSGAPGANAARASPSARRSSSGGADLAAGAYELFTIPSVTEWTVILQKLPEKASWGAYTYDQKNDTDASPVKRSSRRAG